MKGVSLIKQKRGGALNIVLDKKKGIQNQQHKNFFCTIKARINNMSFIAWNDGRCKWFRSILSMGNVGDTRSQILEVL